MSWCHMREEEKYYLEQQCPESKEKGRYDTQVISAQEIEAL